MRIQQSKQSFKGMHVASATVKAGSNATKYDLYKITQQDFPFLENFASRIYLPDLWHGMQTQGYLFWSKVIGSFLRMANTKDMETVLITKDNIPCGGINYKRKNDYYDISYRVTWPVETDKKAPYAGTILYLNLFNKALNENIKAIRTVATRQGPFDVVGKCYQLGFSSSGGDNYNELMSIGQKRMLKTLERYQSQIEINQKNEESDINLSSTLRLIPDYEQK